MEYKLHTTEEVAEIFSVSKSTIKRWADEGVLPCIRTAGGHRKFSSAHIKSFIEQFHYHVDFTQINKFTDEHIIVESKQ